MTRINVVAPADLSNEHLMAEYRELPRIFTHVKNHSIDKSQIADQYLLGKGHVTFFTNKLHYLVRRYVDIYFTLINDRDYNIDADQFKKIKTSMFSVINDYQHLLDEDWQPTPEDKYLNMARLVKRSKFDNAKAEAAA